MNIKIVTANIAGGACEDYSDPIKYKILGEQFSGVDIIGIQEVIQVYKVDNHRVIRDDIKDLKKKSGLSDYQSYFFPYLDSTQQSYPYKWNSNIFRPYYEKGYRILEGIAILVKNQHHIYDLWRNDKPGYAVGQIIPWYSDKPTIYLGDRDTQPRNIILARILLKDKFVLFCCVHLTTLKEESFKQSEKDKRLTTSKAIDIRTKQINWIVQYIKSYQNECLNRDGVSEPIILVGDFNTQPESDELNGLKQLDLELIPFDTSNIRYTHRKYSILMDLIYATKGIISGISHIIDLKELETYINKEISDHNPVIANLEL
jgi:endonuclease/exonuclease/phosphatase family metal-dependent hydrolase